MIRLANLAPAPAYATILAAALGSAWLSVPARTQFNPSAIDSSPTDTGTPAEVPPIAGLRDVPPLTELASDLTARPLLIEGRRPRPMTPEAGVAEDPPEPSAAAAAAAEPPAPAPPTLRYKGFVDTGSGPRALVAWGDGAGEDDWKDIGYEQDGWRIVAITKRELKLSNGADEITVGLYESE